MYYDHPFDDLLKLMVEILFYRRFADLRPGR